MGNLAPAFAQMISHYCRCSPRHILAPAQWKASFSDKNHGFTRIVATPCVRLAFLYPFYSNCWTIYARNVSQQSLCLLVPMAGNRVSPLRRSQSVFLRVVATCLPTHLCASCCAVIAFGLLKATGGIVMNANGFCRHLRDTVPAGCN